MGVIELAVYTTLIIIFLVITWFFFFAPKAPQRPGGSGGSYRPNSGDRVVKTPVRLVGPQPFSKVSPPEGYPMLVWVPNPGYANDGYWAGPIIYRQSGKWTWETSTHGFQEVKSATHWMSPNNPPATIKLG